MSVLNLPIETIVDDFFSAYTERKASKGETVVLPGDHVNHVLYISSGIVTQYAVANNGNKLAMNTYKTGAFLPMMYVLEDRPNEYYFEVTSKVARFRAAPAKDVMTFLESNPEVLLDLLKRLYRGIDGLFRRMAEQMSGTAEGRVRTEILIMAERMGTKQPDGTVKIEVTEQTLANYTGMARETVSRTLPSLLTPGSGISRNGRTFIIDGSLIGD